MHRRENWQRNFDGLSGLSPIESDQLDRAVDKVSLPKGSTVFGDASGSENLFLLVSGSMRIQQLWETGKRIVLFRVHSGESCVQPTSRFPIPNVYKTEAIAETDVELRVIPCKVLEKFTESSTEITAFVFKAYLRCVRERFHLKEDFGFVQSDFRTAQSELDIPGL